MDREEITAFESCLYSVLCFFPYLYLALSPFFHRLRLPARGTAAVCAVWAMAEGAIAFFVVKTGLGPWLLVLHWAAGIPFMLILTEKCWDQVMFAQFFLYSQMAALPYLQRWLSGAGGAMLLGILTVLYFLGIAMASRKILEPILAVGMTAGVKKWSLFWMVPYVEFLLICSSCYFWEEGVEDEYGLITLYILLTNLFFLVIYLIMKSVLQENEETARRESEAKNAALIARQYEEILERQESVRRLRHDMRHFIRVLNELVQNQDLEGIRDYLYQYSEAVDRLLPPHREQICQNPIVNGMASYYLFAARAEGITVSVDCDLGKSLPIGEMELAGIVGNLLENALEACRRMEGGSPFIRMVLKSQGNGILVLIVENSYQGEVRTRGRHFLSSKRDAEGIGLSSVCDGVKRAGGTVKIHYDGKIFQVSVMVTGTQKF